MWEDEQEQEQQQEPLPQVEEVAQSLETVEPVNVAWTDGQLARLQSEWQTAQRSFAYHPVIGVTPLRGEPPHEYQVDYRLRTLAMNDAGELQYVDEVSMHLWLPPGFPNQAPVTRPMANVFHPNIVWDGLFLSRPWSAGDSLVDYIGRIGELLAWRSYDPESVVNATAMDWLAQNSGMLPIDARADFSPYAGGDPMGRIARAGPATLEQIRRALDDLRGALLNEENAMSSEEIEEFARQTRTAVSLFLPADMPATLSGPAREFEEWCRELPASAPAWEYLRHNKARAQAAEGVAATVRIAAAALNVALDELNRLADPAQITTPASAVRVIPPMATLAAMQMKLPSLAADLEGRVAEARGLIEAMKSPAPQVELNREGSLGRRLAAQERSVGQATVAAVAQLAGAVSEVEPLQARVKAQIAALEQVAGWREYMDIFSRGRSIEKQIAQWGSAALQAFFLKNASGSFGPFQLEEVVDLGGTRLLVRNQQGSEIDVVDAVGQEVLGRGARGAVNVVLKSSDGAARHPTSITFTGRCDDLIIQLDFIMKQSAEIVAKLRRPIPGAQSWCGAISHLLADPHQQQNLRDSHRKAGHRWKALMTDMAHLAKFKERLATHHLLARMGEETPRVLEELTRVKERLSNATREVASIISKSTRNMETDQLVIPPKYVKAYGDALRTRDQAKHEITRLENLLKRIAAELAARLADPRLCGRPEIPRFRSLAPLPEDLAVMSTVMGDAQILERNAALGAQLNVQLAVNLPPAPAESHIARPAAPTARPVEGMQSLPPPLIPGSSRPATTAENAAHAAEAEEMPVEQPAEADPFAAPAESGEFHIQAAEPEAPAEEVVIEDFLAEGGQP